MGVKKREAISTKKEVYEFRVLPIDIVSHHYLDQPFRDDPAEENDARDRGLQPVWDDHVAVVEGGAQQKGYKANGKHAVQGVRDDRGVNVSVSVFVGCVLTKAVCRASRFELALSRCNGQVWWCYAPAVW
mmetsp:Transcript_122023/g.345085  ORF Transcript_122023/g.345085 Transcript_122023/m.345085 type:complete len:130 (+) Transcript_122023:736-1125(+)